MKILLTGAAGFVGWKTAELLCQRGDTVVGIDNMNDNYEVSLKEWRLEQLLPLENFFFQKGDIEDYTALKALFGEHQFDAVINLAARAGVHYSMQNPEIYFSTNVLGNLNLLKLDAAHKVPKYVLASTSSLYVGQPMPFVESLPVNDPISPYAASKKSAEVTVTLGTSSSTSTFRLSAGSMPLNRLSFTATGHRFATSLMLTTLHVALKPLGHQVINLGGAINRSQSIR